MMKPFPTILMFGLMASTARDLSALESEALSRPGIQRVQLVTDIAAIEPGKPFTVGLRLDPLPEHHTYWRGPGIVGVATRLDWNLPEGFKVGKTTWPPPELVLMAGIVAQGYKGPTLLLTEILPPAELAPGEVEIAARASWMSCAVSCNPGIADLSLKIPVAAKGETSAPDEAMAKVFAEVRNSAPRPAPGDWSFVPRLAAPGRIELTATIPGLDPSTAPSIRFFCDDMQIDSDSPQQVEVIDPKKGVVRISLVRPEFAPRLPKALSGLLHSETAWPEIGSPHLEISASWPEGTFTE